MTDNTDNTFLQAARSGHNDFWRYLVTFFLVIGLTIGISTCLVLGVMFATGRMDIFSLPATPLLLLNLIPFVILLAALWIGVSVIHRRPFFSLINPTSRRFDWRRFFLSAGVWLALSALSDVILSLLQPENYQFVFEPAEFFPFLLVALLLLPVQSAAEELLFRGYLTQGIGLKGGFWLAWLVPSVLFGLLHGANPEVGTYGVLLTLPTYIIIGLLMGWVTLRSESLELALGLHIINNLYSATLVTFPSSVLQAPALFRIQRFDPLASLVVLVVMVVLYLAIIGLLGKQFFRKGLLALAAAVLVFTACVPLPTQQTARDIPAIARHDLQQMHLAPGIEQNHLLNVFDGSRPTNSPSRRTVYRNRYPSV